MTPEEQTALVEQMLTDVEAHMMTRIDAGSVPADWGPEEYKWWIHGVVRRMFGCKPDRFPERFEKYIQEYQRRML
jgi:hypothetical protein